MNVLQTGKKENCSVLFIACNNDSKYLNLYLTFRMCHLHATSVLTCLKTTASYFLQKSLHSPSF